MTHQIIYTDSKQPHLLPIALRETQIKAASIPCTTTHSWEWPESRILATPKADEDVKLWGLHLVLRGTPNSRARLEHKLFPNTQTLTIHTILESHMRSAYLKEYELCLHRKPAEKGGETLSVEHLPGTYRCWLWSPAPPSHPPPHRHMNMPSHAHSCSYTAGICRDSWGSIIAHPNYAATRMSLIMWPDK